MRPLSHSLCSSSSSSCLTRNRSLSLKVTEISRMTQLVHLGLDQVCGFILHGSILWPLLICSQPHNFHLHAGSLIRPPRANNFDLPDDASIQRGDLGLKSWARQSMTFQAILVILFHVLNPFTGLILQLPVPRYPRSQRWHCPVACLSRRCASIGQHIQHKRADAWAGVCIAAYAPNKNFLGYQLFKCIGKWHKSIRSNVLFYKNLLRNKHDWCYHLQIHDEPMTLDLNYEDSISLRYLLYYCYVFDIRAHEKIWWNMGGQSSGEFYILCLPESPAQISFLQDHDNGQLLAVTVLGVHLRCKVAWPEDMALRAIKYQRGRLQLLDQRLLPFESTYLDVPTPQVSLYPIVCISFTRFDILVRSIVMMAHLPPPSSNDLRLF